LKIPNVRRLFHGTSIEISTIIIEEGFDPTKNRTSAYGKGIYFSNRSLYSKHYCKSDGDIYYMLVCDVATGESCQGIANKPIEAGFDSAVDNLKRPDMYIVNKKEACIPRFRVAFYPNALK